MKIVWIFSFFLLVNFSRANEADTGMKNEYLSKEAVKFFTTPMSKTPASSGGFGWPGSPATGVGLSGSQEKKAKMETDADKDHPSSGRKKDRVPSITSHTEYLNDDKIRDEFRCPAGQTNPSSIGFTLKDGGSIFTGTARFSNGIMAEIAGTMSGTDFSITTYGTNEGNGAYKGQGSMAGAPNQLIQRRLQSELE